MMILSKKHFLVWWLRKIAIPPTDSPGNFCYLYRSYFPGAERQHQEHLVDSPWCHISVHTRHCLLATFPGLLLAGGSRAELWVFLPLWCYLSSVSDPKIKQETQCLEGKGSMWPNYSPWLCIRKTFLQLSEQNAIFVLVTPSRFYLELHGNNFFPNLCSYTKKIFHCLQWRGYKLMQSWSGVELSALCPFEIIVCCSCPGKSKQQNPITVSSDSNTAQASPQDNARIQAALWA